jgi:hypothetical protein
MPYSNRQGAAPRHICSPRRTFELEVQRTGTFIVPKIFVSTQDVEQGASEFQGINMSQIRYDSYFSLSPTDSGYASNLSIFADAGLNSTVFFCNSLNFKLLHGHHTFFRLA